MVRRFLAMIGLGLLAGMPVLAQDRPDPTDPKGPAAAPAYRSAYEGYRRFAMPRRIPWKDANAAVAEKHEARDAR